MPEFAGFEELKAAGLDEKAAKKFIKSQIHGQAMFLNRVATKCFTECVTSFRSRELAEHENTCLDNCADKYFEIATILDGKYWEYQHKMQEEATERMANMS